MTFDANCRFAHYPMLGDFRAEITQSLVRDVLTPRGDHLSQPVVERIYTHFMSDADCAALERHQRTAEISRSMIFVEPKAGAAPLAALDAALEHVALARSTGAQLDYLLPFSPQLACDRASLEARAQCVDAAGFWVRSADIMSTEIDALALLCAERRLILALDLLEVPRFAHDATAERIAALAVQLRSSALLLASVGFAAPELIARLPRQSHVFIDLTGFQQRADQPASLRKWLEHLAEIHRGQLLFGSGWPRYYFRRKQSDCVALLRDALGIYPQLLTDLTDDNYRALLGRGKQ